MIKKLDFSNPTILSESLNLQRAAYEIEADLIGSRNIPPLQESVDQLKAAKENFFGFFLEERLVGFAAVEEESSLLRISRLVVSPQCFRKGIGKKLIQYIMTHKPREQSMIVSTGAGNTPARKLYENFGFLLNQTFVIDGISIVEYIFTG